MLPRTASNSGEASFFYLFDWLKRDNWPDDPTYEQIKQCALSCQGTSGKPCTDLVLLDAPLAPHSDIQRIQSVDRNGNPLVPGPAEGSQSCTVAERFSKEEHGTHLASIIASQLDDKGFMGISPGLDVYAFPWTRDTTFAELRRFIRERTKLVEDAENPDAGAVSPVVTKGSQVFVFASQFPPPDDSDLDLQLFRRLPEWIPAEKRTQAVGEQRAVESGGRTRPTRQCGSSPQCRRATEFQRARRWSRTWDIRR